MACSPVVSVIILNWNGKRYLSACLDSLRAQTLRDVEVIVVDNGSVDGSVEFIETHYGDRVHLIALPQNRGFAGGNNVGIGQARGRYVALLNNDIEAHPEWLANLVSCMEHGPQIGMVGSKVLNFCRRDEIDNTGHLMYPDGLNRGRGRLERDTGQYDGQREILFPSGCAALYRRKMLEEIGGFDETFFAYGDDADIGLHGRLLGYDAVFCPEAVVYHRYSGTVGSYSAMKAFHVERNRIWILLKYFPVSSIVTSPFYTLARFALHAYGIFTGRGAAGRFATNASIGRLVRTILRAYASAIRGLPGVLRRRKRIVRHRKLTGGEFRKLLVQHRISCREIALKD
ncbi:MAG: glycosyltransferase family 2 protein [Deltaproteobacteria bacterium]|nr:glycosyltransferase family 2 protein [Deltaproteobacteria bacterium]